MNKITLRRRYIDSQGYDNNGRYWGVGEPLYDIIDGDGDVIGNVRAKRGETKQSLVARVRQNVQAAIRG